MVTVYVWLPSKGWFVNQQVGHVALGYTSPIGQGYISFYPAINGLEKVIHKTIKVEHVDQYLVPTYEDELQIRRKEDERVQLRHMNVNRIAQYREDLKQTGGKYQLLDRNCCNIVAGALYEGLRPKKDAGWFERLVMMGARWNGSVAEKLGADSYSWAGLAMYGGLSSPETVLAFAREIQKEEGENADLIEYFSRKRPG